VLYKREKKKEKKDLMLWPKLWYSWRTRTDQRLRPSQQKLRFSASIDECSPMPNAAQQHIRMVANVLPVAYQMHSWITEIGSQIRSISSDLTLITRDFTEDHPAYLYLYPTQRASQSAPEQHNTRFKHCPLQGS